jgi:hypothetical protein
MSQPIKPQRRAVTKRAKASYKMPGLSQDANCLTGAIIEFLKLSGIEAWRNNTYGLYDQKTGGYRRLQYQQKGVSDIIGFFKSGPRKGQFIGIEVKVNKDVLSTEQGYFLDKLNEAGCIAIVARDFNQFLSQFTKLNSL